MSAGTSTTTLSLDQYGDLTSHATTAGAGASSVFSESLARDQLGRIARRTSTDDTGTHVEDYTYDAAGRLTQVTRDGAVSQTFGYDATGALTSRGSGLLSGSFTLDPYGHPTGTPDGSTVVWNADGEQTSITSAGGQQTGFSYDGFGRLTGVTLPDGRQGSYRYDARWGAARRCAWMVSWCAATCTALRCSRRRGSMRPAACLSGTCTRPRRTFRT